MATHQQTIRKPNFKNDIKKYGEFAENDFIELFNKNQLNQNKKLFDVRQIKEYQLLDIDFVIVNQKQSELPDIDIVLNDKNKYQTIEVKYNGRALDTGWIAFEYVSHGKPGWGLISKCDLMYTVFGKEVNNQLYIEKRAWIYFDKWKEYINNKNHKKVPNYINNENVFDVLTNLQDMIDKKIIKEIK